MANQNTPVIQQLNGNVGIGEAAPARKLHVSSTAGQDGIYVNAATYPELVFFNGATVRSYIGIAGSAGGYNSGTLAASLILRSESSYMHFITGPSPGSITIPMTINAGCVGIGTVTPASPFHVYNASSFNTILETTTTNNVQLRFRKSGTDKWSIYVGNSSNDLTFWDGTSDRLTFQSGGNVGIGNTSPGAKLDVNGEGAFVSNSSSRVLYLKQNATNAGNIIQFRNEAGGDIWEIVGRNNQFYIYNTALTSHALYIVPGNNNVGIGTTSPAAKLEVNGTSGDGSPTFRVTSTAAGSTFNWAGSLMNSSLGSSRNYILLIGQAESTKNSGYIGFNHSGTGGSNSNFLTFGLYGNDNILNINGAGSVGIGTTGPSYKLQVNGDVFFTNSSGNFGSNYVYVGDSNWGFQTIGSDGLIGDALRIRFYDTGARGFGFYDTSGNVYRMVIKSGNVGIGTTSPSQKLEVNGSIKAGIAGNSSANTPALRVTSAGTATSQAAIAIQQTYSEGDTIIFADFDQYTEWNFMHENNANQFIIHGGSSTNTLGSNTFYSPDGTAKTGYKKHIFDQTNGDMYVGGSVGIGTSSPTSKVAVNTSFSTINGVTISTDDYVHSQLILRKAASKTAYGIMAWESQVYVGAGIYYEGGTWVHHNSNNNNQLFVPTPGTGVNWYASNNGAGSWNVASNVTLWNDSGYWKNLVQSTATGDSYFTGGNVGIGTTSPSYKFQVYSGADEYAIAWSRASTKVWALGTDTAGTYINNRTDSVLPIYIKNDGNVGIGNTSPSYKLEVTGNTKITGNLTVTQNLSDAAVNGRILLYGNLHIDAFNGYDIYANYYSSRRFRTFYGSYSESFRADTDGIVYAYNQFRTPIMYDHNDTSYYVDPASTSVLNSAYGLTTTFTATGSAGTYVWVRASMGGFNDGGDMVKFTIARSIFDNSNSPYGGPSADFTVSSREWHSGQDYCIVNYSEHGSSSGAGGYYISHAGPKDQAGGGYWFYMRLEGGITYKMRRAVGSGPISNFSSTSDPGGIPAIVTWGKNILTTQGTTAGLYSQGTITTAGSVGIGTNSPSTPLHIYKTGLADNSTNALLTIDGKFAGASVDANDIVGIAFRVENSGGGSQTTTSIGSSYQGSYNGLLLQPTGGNVGIGLKDPLTKLHILSSTPTSVTSIFSNSDIVIDSNTNSYINFRQTADNGLYGGFVWTDNNHGAYIVFRNWQGSAATGGDSLIYGTYQDHIFQAGSSATINGRPEVMRITSAGSVGIGTAGPGAKLDVVGTVYASGNITSNATMYAQSFVDAGDNGYYCDPNSVSRLYSIRSDYYADTGGTHLFKMAQTSGATRHLNLSTDTSDPSTATCSTGISWGSRSDSNPYYIIRVAQENYNSSGNYNKLELNWHTGIKIGAATTYGGTRFYDNSPGVGGTEIFSVGRGDGHVRVVNKLYVSTANTTGNGIVLADDGDIVDLNDGWASHRFSYGLRIYSANGGGSTAIQLANTAGGNSYINTTGNVGIGNSSCGWKLDVSGDIAANGGWMRVYGQRGIYFQDYGGGWYQTDTTWVKVYNDKPIYTGGGAYFGGSVGIGYTTPQSKLHIYGGTAHTELRVTTDDGYKSRIGMYEESAGSTWGAYVQYNGAGDNLEFGHKRNTVDSSPEMVITYNGSVGIGTTSPGQALHVAGAIRYNSNSNPITEYSGTVATADNYPTCDAKARIYTIGTINANANYNAYIEVEVIGSHRGYTVDSYYEYKRWIITVGDKVSSRLVFSCGAVNKVGLWNGTDATGYKGASASPADEANGKVLKLIVNSSCGSGFTYTVKVKYADLNLTHGPFTSVDHTTTSVTIPLSQFHINGDNPYIGIETGNVGVGNSSLAYKLDIAGTLRSTGASYFATTSGNVGIGTTSASNKLVVNGGQTLFGDLTFGSDQTAYYIKGPANGGAIRIRSNGGAATDRNVQLGNVDNNGSWTSFMTVDNGGQVNIGQTGAISSCRLSLLTGNTARFGMTDGTVTSNMWITSNQFLISTETNHPILFITNQSEKMRIAADGNVGIGTTSPGYKLDVNGSCQIRGGLGSSNVSPYSSANRIIFDNDYTDVARGPNKIQLYDSGWLGGLGVHNNTFSYYSGGNHSWYQATTTSNATHLMTVNTTGLGIGKESPLAKLDVNGNTLISGSLTVGTGSAQGVSGEIRARDNITAYYTSDERLKTNIIKIDSALHKVKQIDGVLYDWTDEFKKERGGEDGYFIRNRNSGIIAQQVEKVFPNVVADKQDGYKAVRYELLVPLLIEAIKEQDNHIENLKNELTELKKAINSK